MKKDMLYSDRWDSLIAFWSGTLGMDWLLIKAVIRQESGGNALAVSPAGACGLMQLMPATAKDLNVTYEHIHDPDCNLRAGITYLRDQVRHFPEIPDETERIKFSLAAYNAGRGNINKAIKEARKASEADWTRWDVTNGYLGKITGHHSKETITYVERIMKYWGDFLSAEKAEVAETVEMINGTKKLDRITG